MATSVNLAQNAPESIQIEEVYQVFKSHPNGLKDEEARARLEQYGQNSIQKIGGKALYKKFLANFTHLMALLLWCGGIVAFVAKMPQLGMAIWMVNLINGSFSFWQEYRAEKATDALKKMLPDLACVLRDGQEQTIPAEELIPGDVVLISEGDNISADARLVQVTGLRCDQSTLTGESRPVQKTFMASEMKGTSHIEAPNLVFAGTTAATGSGKAIVFATGMDTEFGKIARLTQTMGDELSPLQKEMDKVTRMVTVIAITIGSIFFVLAVLFTKVTLVEGFIFTLGMIVAFVPEGLLPTVTLALAMGTQRMARRNALIKKLSSVETLGCTTVILTDKTGTLTQNEMTVRSLWLPAGRLIEVGGIGYDPCGQLIENRHPIKIEVGSDGYELLLAGAMCNNSRLVKAGNNGHQHWKVLGDPTEAAMRVAAAKGNLDMQAAEQQFTRVKELPFDSHRMRMTTIHWDGDPSALHQVAYVKGAPKEILQLCNAYRVKGQIIPINSSISDQAVAANDDFARNGLRVLAVAERAVTSELGGITPETIEQNLTFLGLEAMMDPPRTEVAEAVAKCKKAGIRIVMITGDYGLTAESIARKVGIVAERPRIVTGMEMDVLDDQTLKKILQSEVIFARVAPENKLRVVNLLQEMGEVVAVTGDGVNDSPALKKADIGVAMGINGSDVAKEAADIILTDDNFASIVNAIEEGRSVYANIKKFASYIFTSNMPEAVPFLLYVLSGGRIPLALNVMHVLSIDLGTDLVPALGLGAEPPEPGVMDNPPRDLKDHIVTRRMLVRSLGYLGLTQSLAVMAAFYFTYWINGYGGQFTGLPSQGSLYQSATAMALAMVVTTQIGNLFTQRSERISSFRLPLFKNRLIWIGIATELLVILLIVYFPPLQHFIGTNAFPASYWLFLFLWTPALLLVDEVVKMIKRSKI